MRSALRILILIATLGAVMVLPGGAAAARGQAVRPAGHRESAVRILAPSAGAVLRDGGVIALRVRLWTRHDASLRLTFNRQPIVVNARQERVRVVARDGAFILSARLRANHLPPGIDRLTASIRDRRGVRVSDTVALKGPRAHRPGGLGSEPGNAYNVYGTTTTDSSMELSNNGDPFIDLYPINWAEDVPAARLIPPTTSSAWQVSAAQPYFELDYQILTPSGAPSGYWLWTHFDDPFFGSNSGTCSITTTDSSGPHPLNAPAAPYTCFWTNVGGSNPHPTLHVQAATLVTDPAEALQLAQNNCRTGAPHCIFSDVTFGASVGNSAPVGAVYVNESQQEGTHSIDWSKTVEESNTITTSVQVSATLNKLIQVQITVGYSHEWSTSTTFGETDSIDVPAGYAGWFTFIPGLQTASGGFFVTDRSNDTFLTKRANATFTTSDGRGAVIPHTCKLVPGTDPNPPQGCQTAVTNGAPILVSGTPSR